MLFYTAASKPSTTFGTLSLFERGETVLATAMPRVVRTDLGQDPIRGHYALATTIWAV